MTLSSVPESTRRDPAPQRRHAAPTTGRRWTIPAAAVAGCLVSAAVILGVQALSQPGTATIKGSLGLLGSEHFLGKDGATCEGYGGYEDIGEGASVTVYDSAGRTVATSHLDQGTATGSTFCTFTFTVAGVPDSDFYGVEISHRGKVTFSRQQIADTGAQVTLGSV